MLFRSHPQRIIGTIRHPRHPPAEDRPASQRQTTEDQADGGKAKKIAIKIGFNDGAKVEVLSGLTGSETVILVGKLTLADGAAVNVTEAK